jgi:hypothetical protein
MVDLEELVARAIRSPVADPPEVDAVRSRARTRRRRRNTWRVVVIGGVAAAAAVGGFAALRSESKSTDIVAVLGTGAPSTVPQPITRPVLTSCTATSAQEGTMTGTGHTDPEQEGEVFAVPDAGVKGPLAVVLRYTATGTTDVRSLGSMPNATVSGQPASYGAGQYGQSGLQWLLPAGGQASIYARDLSEPDVLALAEAVSNSSQSFPAGLVSLGITSRASWARSTCADGAQSTIEVIHGSRASRYAAVTSEPPGVRWDDGDDTYLFVSLAAPPDPIAAQPVVAQASVEQWNALLAAGRPPVSAPPGS